MTKRLQVYKCDVCGNIVEMVHAGAGELVCCGQPMVLQAENTVDAAKEKHVPVVTAVKGGFKVTVGAVAHPMEENTTSSGLSLWPAILHTCSFSRRERHPRRSS